MRKPTMASQKAEDALPHPDDDAVAKTRIAYGRIRGPFFDAIMEKVTRLAFPYSKMTEQQQREFDNSIRSRIDANLDWALRAMFDADLPRITAKLGDFTVKEDAIVGKYETVRTQTAIHELGAHGLKPVHIILADPKLMDDGSYSEKDYTTPDQPGFDDLLDHPSDDSDLAGEEDQEETDDAESGGSAPPDPDLSDPAATEAAD